MRFTDPDGMWPDWGQVGMFLGGVAQSIQHGINGVKSFAKDPVGSMNRLERGLKNGSVKNALINLLFILL